MRKRENCSEKASLKRRDYGSYCWKRGERLVNWILAAAVVIFLAYFFYRDLRAVPFLLPVGVLFYREQYRRKGEKERLELGSQFRECILSVATLLGAGYSVENAFVECAGDMQLMYGADAMICTELKTIRRGLHINVPLEEMLNDFGERSHSKDMLQFAEVFAIAKRSGGNLADIIRSSSELIGRKAEVRQEIDTLLAGRKMELGIMRVMPFVITGYISLSTPGFFELLYEGVIGRLIMTGCLLAYMGAWFLGELMMDRMREKME